MRAVHGDGWFVHVCSKMAVVNATSAAQTEEFYVRDSARFVRLFGDNQRVLVSGISTVQAGEPCPISLVA